MSEPNDDTTPPGKIDGKYQSPNEKRLSTDGGAYCTMFAFEGVKDPNILHCTHKYFGAGKATRDQIIRALEKHFSMKPFQRFKVPFTVLDQFGEAGDYRVLRPESNAAFMLDLKQQLDQIEPDSYPEYKPHVTVGRNTDSLDVAFRDYVLMENHVPVWSAMSYMRRLERESRENMTHHQGKTRSLSERRLEIEKGGGYYEEDAWHKDIKGPNAV